MLEKKIVIKVNDDKMHFTKKILVQNKLYQGDSF